MAGISITLGWESVAIRFRERFGVWRPAHQVVRCQRSCIYYVGTNIGKRSITTTIDLDSGRISNEELHLSSGSLT